MHSGDAFRIAKLLAFECVGVLFRIEDIPFELFAMLFGIRKGDKTKENLMEKNDFVVKITN